ncbi:hypothetical protein CEE36_03235 [candidate division TA06 bacterium B3_TA06]|uniref:Tyr recombinase domain-containing protein n=1 Tax=candidate division TA06 bacterium B3_TA06 TaxID=2012487 RepID=A0A532V922_UNCT6|nr:MAG: hypothetical protein CEE36_03235 [candidate division TA06 bacterium B3_TA06]
MRVYQCGKRWYVEDSYNPKRYRRSAGRTKREALLKLGEIERYKEVWIENVKSASVNRELALLRHMLRKAIDWDYLRKENPASRVKQFKEPSGRVRYLSFEEREQLLEACKRTGIEDFHCHSLRHTFASYRVMAGVDIRTVQVLMGHKDIKMTMRYSHLSKRYLRKAVNRMVTNWSQVEDAPVEQSPKLRS